MKPRIPTDLLDIELTTGDIFLTRGNGIVSKGIRFFSRSVGEPRAPINHVGLVIEPGTVEKCIIIETLHTVKRHRMWYQYGPTSSAEVAVYRPKNLTFYHLFHILHYAEKQVGKNYGYVKIAAHFLDYFLFGAYAFRRITFNDNYPICSWLVANAYAKAGKDFNVKTGQAQPDDIWNFVNERTDKYDCIFPLQKIWW